MNPHPDIIYRKIRVRDWIECERVQNALFKLGCIWYQHRKPELYVRDDMGFLYISSNGKIGWDLETSETNFEDRDEREITPSNVYKLIKLSKIEKLKIKLIESDK